VAKNYCKVDTSDWTVADYRYDSCNTFSIESGCNQIEPLYSSKKEYKKKLRSIVSRIDDLLEIMYAQNRYGLLLVFQAMDAAGKDGTIKRLLTGVNPAAVQVYSFKKPSDEELDHGYLWRIIQRMPERGRLGEILTDYQRLPAELIKDTDAVFESRFDQIRNFEKYANVSQEEQRQRLVARLDDPDKHWKFAMADVEEREHWPAYMNAFEDCINSTAATYAPWYAVPADDKLNMRLLVAATVLAELESLDIDWPKADKKLLENMDSIRKRLA